MSEAEQRAILTICLMAAFADGANDERERDEVKRIAESLAPERAVDMAEPYQEVLMGRINLPAAAGTLQSAESKLLAYEMAVCVCNADGMQSDAERAFLARLRDGLGLARGPAQLYSDRAESVAAAAIPSPDGAPQADVDKLILDAAILNGALELLPESLATMAIIPLQMRLVYRVGAAFGYQLDRGHITDFLATAGVGLTSQYLEQAGRKLLGGLLGSIGGGLLGGVARQAVSSGMSFASTYALGQVARRYYADGRTLSGQLLRESFAQMLEEAKGLQARYLPDMQAQARTLNASSLADLVRGA